MTDKKTGKNPRTRSRACSSRDETRKSPASRELLELGKSKGYVTLDDVHEALDPEMVEQDDILGVLAALREGHIEVRDGAATAAKVEGRPKLRPTSASSKPATASPTTSASTCATWARCRCSSREGEVTIAKRIEDARDPRLHLAFRSAAGRRHVER